MEWLAFLQGPSGQALIAGGLGGLVRWLSLKESFRDGLVSVTVGAICALYLSPLALPAVEQIIGKIVVDQVAQAGLSAFLIGMGGLGVVGLFLDFWSARRKNK